MQYYISLSSSNSFHKIQTISRAQFEETTMIETAPASTSSGIDESTDHSRTKKFEKNVKFSTDGPQTLEPIMETTRANNKTNSCSNESSLENVDEEREFDMVIFAASGCVGKFLVEELALVVDKQFSGSVQSSDSPPFSSQQQQFAQQALRRRSVPSSSMSEAGLKWAVAGRSAVRLSETLCRAELSTGIKNLSKAIPVLLADLNHEKSLANLCQKTRLLINCAGPYSELGAELLIRSCIETRTHYIDLAHEVTFIELMRHKYSERAREANIFVLNGCGFQSMSAQMGLNFTKQVVDGTIEQVKIILSMSDTSALIKTPDRRRRASGIISEGMWNSLLAEKAQEVSLEDRLRVKVADRDQLIYQQQQKHQQQQEEEQQEMGTSSYNQKQSAAASATQASTSATASLLGGLSSQTRSLTNKILERKDTQSLVRDIVQFRNRSVSLAWPLRLIQGFQGKSGRGYCWPIDNMSSDEAQLIRTEMNNYELRRPDLDSHEGWRPIRCSTFLSVKNFTQVTLLFFWLFIFQLLVRFSLFRYFMRKFPQLATLGHVVSSSSVDCSSAGSRQQRSVGGGQQTAIERDALGHIKFCQTFIAYGTPSDDSADPLERRDRHAARKQVQLLVSRVVGPEPNHVATATLAVQAALTVLTERDHLPCPGGVLTPGAAFSETNIIYQLRKRNIKFEVLKKA